MGAARRTGGVRMGFVTADEVAEVFGIAEPTGAVVEAARGWGGHNVVYRLDTTIGRWAVKALGRDLNELYRESFAIEMAACPGGGRMPRPVPTADGDPYAVVGGRWLRCHEWVEGVAKPNEETTCEE